LFNNLSYRKRKKRDDRGLGITMKNEKSSIPYHGRYKSRRVFNPFVQGKFYILISLYYRDYYAKRKRRRRSLHRTRADSQTDECEAQG